MQPINTAAVQAADDRIHAAEARIADLERKRGETEQAARDAERKAAENFEASDKLDAGAVIRLQGELRIITQAIEAARGRLPALYLERERVEAGEYRRLSAEKIGEAEHLEEACRKPLAKLSELQGIEFTLSILSSQPTGPWYATFGEIVAPPEYLGLPELHPDVTGKIGVPKSRKLRAEAVELEQHAGTLEAEIRAAQPREVAPEAPAPAPSETLYGQPVEHSLLNPNEISPPRRYAFYRND